MRHSRLLVVWLALTSAGLLQLPAWASPAAYQEKREDRKAAIKSEPHPEDDEGRNHHYNGAVTVRAILRSDGKVTDIEVIEITPNDLPEEVAKDWARKCIEAASQIKFKPAMKNGHPVSQYVRLVYTFKE